MNTCITDVTPQDKTLNCCTFLIFDITNCEHYGEWDMKIQCDASLEKLQSSQFTMLDPKLSLLAYTLVWISPFTIWY